MKRLAISRVAPRHIPVQTHQAEPIAQFNHMIRAGIGYREPSSRAQHSRRLREVFRGEDAHDQIDGFILAPANRSTDPRPRRPAPATAAQPAAPPLRDVETQADDWWRQRRS